MKARCPVLLLILALLAGSCSEPSLSDVLFENELDHSDFQNASAAVGGMPASFTPDRIMEDSLFLDSTALSAESIQEFLLNTPYGMECKLAHLTGEEGQPASQMINDAAVQWGINPILLLARLQVESGLISSKKNYAYEDLDYNLGCGCPDYRSDCISAYKGLKNQLTCAAQVLRMSYEASADSNGIWVAGQTRKSLDQIAITPQTHATAALYTYTPWVLRGEGGNWLVWNITRRYIAYLNALGHWHYVAPGWIGSSCAEAGSPVCAYTHLDQQGYCYLNHPGAPGFCSLPCAGYCPDQDGVITFCTDLGSGHGTCVAKATAANEDCAAIPGTVPEERERYVGESKVLPSSARVCVPLYPN